MKKIILSIFSLLILLDGNIRASIRPNNLQENINHESIIAPKQGKTVQGIVLDRSGSPIVGVTIIEKGTTNGVTSDIEGKFSLQVAPDATLTFSYLGYIEEEAMVKGQDFLKVTMREDTETLDEVVVIGYGTAKRSNLTGAVSSVTSEQFRAQPVKKPPKFCKDVWREYKPHLIQVDSWDKTLISVYVAFLPSTSVMTRYGW